MAILPGGFCKGCESPILAATVERTGGFCLPCYCSGTFCPPPPEYRRDRRVPVNALLWSERSKRVLSDSSPPREYRDKLFTCDACASRSVFTADQQQQAFELGKANVFANRSLCNLCWPKWHDLQQELKSCRDRWQLEKLQLLHSQVFQRKWLALLLAVASFGRTSDQGNIAMLKRLLANCDS